MTNQPKQNLKKDCLTQNLKILLWGLLTLLLVVLTILEMIPTDATALRVEEVFRVSSSMISVSEKTYVSAVSGTLANPGDEAVRIDSVIVTVGNGEVTKDIVMDGFVLMPRSSEELTSGWTGNIQYDRITRLCVVVDGEKDVLTNIGSSLPVNGIAIFYLILLFPAALLLVRSCKIRYYIYQEMQMQDRA